MRSVHRPCRRRDEPRSGRRHRLSPAQLALHHERAHALARSSGGRSLHRLGTRPVRWRRRLCARQRLCQLHAGRRERSHREGLRPELPAPQRNQAALRPGQSVPVEPEHQAERQVAAPAIALPNARPPTVWRPPHLAQCDCGLAGSLVGSWSAATETADPAPSADAVPCRCRDAPRRPPRRARRRGPAPSTG